CGLDDGLCERGRNGGVGGLCLTISDGL
ncbi:unnamed protein product, partial [Acanthocheilonema viteae]